MRILIISFTRSSLGHLMRSIAIAKEMRTRNHNVLFACSKETIDIPRSFDLKCAVVYEIEPKPPWEKINTMDDLIAMTKKRLASNKYISQCLEDEIQLIKNFQPDVIIHDMRVTSGVVASIHNIPSIAIHNMELFHFPLPTVMPLVMKEMKKMGIDPKHIEKIFGDVLVIPDFSYFAPLTKIPEEIHMILKKSVREILFTGPLMVGAPSIYKNEHNLKSTSVPLIYITLGGSQNNSNLFLSIIKNLPNSASYIISTGKQEITNEINKYLETFDGNSLKIQCKTYLKNSNEIMMSADLAVIHGGHGTLLEGLVCGTPLIVIPQNSEQRMNGLKSYELGCGKIIEKNEVNKKLMHTIKNFLTDNNIRKKSKLLSKKLLNTNGVEKLADYVENMLF